MVSGYGRAPAERRRRGEVFAERRPALDGEGNEMERRTASGEIRKQMITGERVQSRVDIHYRRKQITKRQHVAGTRFADCVERMTVSIRGCLNTEISGGCRDAAARETGERQAAASAEYRSAVQLMGLKLTSVITWVAVDGLTAQAWAERARLKLPRKDGLVVLRVGLDTLADFYGLDSEGNTRI